MKLILRQIEHEPSSALGELIRRRLDLLGRRIVIEEALVTLEHRAEASPAFCVSAHIVIPGPDLSADACDYTMRAALEKTIGQLDLQIRHRHEKRAWRMRSNLQGRRCGGATVHRDERSAGLKFKKQTA